MCQPLGCLIAIMRLGGNFTLYVFDQYFSFTLNIPEPQLQLLLKVGKTHVSNRSGSYSMIPKAFHEPCPSKGLHNPGDKLSGLLAISACDTVSLSGILRDGVKEANKKQI